MRYMQRRHRRVSKKGKPFLAGHKVVDVSDSMKNKIFKEKLAELAKELKQKKRVRLPDLGILHIKVKPARPARMGINPFTQKKQMFKARPKTNVVKFRTAKSFKDLL